jgi:hypothetical protein
VHGNCVDARADSHQAVEVREAFELLAELRPRLRPIAFLRATGHSHGQIQEVTGLSRSRVGQLVQSAHEGLWEAAAERRWTERPQAPRAERLRSLEEDPPAWLVETLGSPPHGRDQATRLQLWRRAALVLDDYRERSDRGRAQEVSGGPDHRALERMRETAARAVQRYHDAGDRGIARDGIACER